MTAISLKVKGQAGVIFFDAAGTLIRLARPVGWHYAEIARRHSLKAEQDTMETAFRRNRKAMPARQPEDGPRKDDDRPWWQNLATVTLREATTIPDGFDENSWFEELYDHFAQPGVWVLFDDVQRCLERMSRTHRIAVISNFDRRLRRILSDLGIAGAFEHLFISSEIGSDKPDREIFRKAVETMGTPASECLHVGDDPEKDWAGAEAAGLKVFQLKRPDRSLDDLRP